MSNEKIPVRSLFDMTPQEVREKINQQIMGIDSRSEVVFSVKDQAITRDGRDTRLRVYVPNLGPSRPLILFIHGGAWVAGNLDTHDNLARYLCSQVGAVVASVEYGNSPEAKFPLPLEQCVDALMWMIEHAPDFFLDVSRTAVVGDSAGGNLAAALCLLMRDRSGPKINLQVLINPAPDLTCKGKLERDGDAFLDAMRWQAVAYVSDPQDVYNGYVSPLVAKDLSKLPEAMILLAEHDDLREDGQKYADRLKAAGVQVSVYCQSGIGHLAGHGARASALAKESLDVAVEALRKSLKPVFPPKS